MLYKEYDEKTLHRLQQIELEILRDFDELCTENGLSYFGCGGTAIGAVRHHGMIPWDDDIDVGLLRKDYEKFLRIARQKKWRRIIPAETCFTDNHDEQNRCRRKECPTKCC
jgi:lipopolysaccharide cholinephosphotransferase